ncbi:MAG: hypothetical protein M3Z50_08605, partial [Actinomycetota bacterium]|nr:hypothetical protein [Actinomycetota bacterium]
MNVTGTTAGVKNNAVQVSSDQGTGSTGTAMVTVLPPTDAYQLHYLANLDAGDGVINITNAGALGGDAFGTAAGTTGRICVNVYAFTPDEQEMACCS